MYGLIRFLTHIGGRKMKRISLFIIGLFLCYIIYYDFQIGTLPAFSMTNGEETPTSPDNYEKSNKIPYYEVKIKQGDTVLSVIERYHGTLPTSIEQIVEDFEGLNANVKAESILLGETYRFPDYKQ
jgi:phage tail protein X